MAKKNSTFSIDEDVKRDFNIEVLRNGHEMSESVETMMRSYIRTSKSLHELKDKKNGQR